MFFFPSSSTDVYLPLHVRKQDSKRDFDNLTVTSKKPSSSKPTFSYVMVKIGPPSPNVNTLDVDEQWTYADTAKETWQIIKFFLEELKPVNTEDLDAENGTCSICVEKFTKDLHRPVRLPCNHCFGEPCIKIWLSPYAPAWEPYFELQEGG